MKTAEKNLSLQLANKNFMQKKVSLTNQKDVQNADPHVEKTTEKTEECMMLFVQNVEHKLKFHSNLYQEEKYFAKNVFKNFPLKIRKVNI